MTDTPRAAPSTARHRRSTPVDYAEIRTTLQRVRLVFGAVFLGVSLAAWSLGIPSAPVRIVASALLVIDAGVRLRSEGGALPSLLVDAVAGALITGVGVATAAPLVAMLGYLVVAAVLLLPTLRAAAVFAGGALAVAGRSLIVDPTPTVAETLPAATVAWVDVTLSLLALALMLIVAKSQIREARDRQDAALQAEQRASDLKGEFVSMISHELRTPLTNISGFSIALRESWRALEPKEIDEFLSIVCAEADRLTGLVDDVLAIPRLEAGRLLLEAADFQLRAVAFRIADSVFPAGGQKSAAVSVAGNVMVHADPNRVGQVLRNLLDNARKYGGDQVGIEAVPRGDTYVVVVADNGPGVPETERDRIFERFEQSTRGDARSDSGFGLGLAVTRRLVEAMGGEAWYEPGFPVGARFCFTLPAAEAAAAPKTKKRKAQPRTTGARQPA